MLCEKPIGANLPARCFALTSPSTPMPSATTRNLGSRLLRSCFRLGFCSCLGRSSCRVGRFRLFLGTNLLKEFVEPFLVVSTVSAQSPELTFKRVFPMLRWNILVVHSPSIIPTGSKFIRPNPSSTSKSGTLWWGRLSWGSNSRGLGWLWLFCIHLRWHSNTGHWRLLSKDLLLTWATCLLCHWWIAVLGRSASLWWRQIGIPGSTASFSRLFGGMVLLGWENGHSLNWSRCKSFPPHMENKVEKQQCMTLWWL